MTTRPLTAGEIQLAKTLFGNAVDYAVVRISDQPAPLQNPNSAMVVGNTIYTHNCYHDDYSKASAFSRALFVHEMTHIWQGQNKIFNQLLAVAELQLKHKFNYSQAYFFKLDAGKDLLDYGLEQQAAIVEEYFLNTREGYPSYMRHCTNKCSNAERVKLYEKVLEKFLANPAYAKKQKLPNIFKGKKPKP
jgi:hypothetical protein